MQSKIRLNPWFSQLRVALAGINMFGIGLIMIHLANKKDAEHNSGDSEVSTE
jgi:hypothetical protein